MKTPVYNPLDEDFTVTYDIDGTGEPKAYTAYAQEISFFDPIIAGHMRKHLADKIVWDMWDKGQKTNFEDDLKEAVKKTEVLL